MSEMTEVYEPGDIVYVKDYSGRIWVWMIQPNGQVVLVSEPLVTP